MSLRLTLFAGALLTLVAAAHPDPRHSLEDLDTHITENPSNPDFYLAKAEVYRGLKLLPEATAAVDAAAKLIPQDSRIDLARAQLDVLAGKSDQAISRLESLVKAKPDFDEPWRVLGRLQRDAGQVDAGIASSRKYLSLAVHASSDDYTDLASRLARRAGPGDREEAVTLLDRAASHFGGLIGIQLMAAELEVEMGRIDPALKRYEAIAVRFRPRAEWSIRTGEILMKAGRAKEAMPAFDGALALLAALPPARRDHPEALRLRAVATTGKAAAQAAIAP